MNNDNKNGFKQRKVLLGLLIIAVSIGFGYGLFLATKSLSQGNEITKVAMSEQNENQTLNQEISMGNTNNKEIEDRKNSNNLELSDDISDTGSGKEGKEDNEADLAIDSKNAETDTNNIKLTVGELIANKIKKDQNDDIVNESIEETTKIPTKVRGIYVTGPRAGSSKYMDDLVDLVDTTELNTMVIDIKNDSGEITYDMDLPIVQEIGANGKYISDMKKLVQTLKEKDIYLIARVVAFKDPILAKKKPELSIKNENGSIFHDKSGLAWVNPYKKEVWDYLMDISKEAVKLGFDEIQFDYIRFSTDKEMKNADFGKEAINKSKLEIITEFTEYASEILKPLGVYVSADVYGAIIDSEVDAKIVGQNYAEMSKHLDYISPMVYPSHYADGSYGIPHPDLEPYKLILRSMEASKIALEKIPESESKAIVRPWLQDFTASWLKHYKEYNGEEIKDQIKAVYDAGYDEWILWNGSNNYTKSGLELVK